MAKYAVNYKSSYGSNNWENRIMYQIADSAAQAISYTLDDLEANLFDCDWLRLEPGQYSNGAEYTAEDEDSICIECYKDFTTVKLDQ